MSNATRIGTEPSKTARWIILVIVGLVFAIPIISMIDFTFRVGPAGGYTVDHWTALFDPAEFMTALRRGMGPMSDKDGTL